MELWRRAVNPWNQEVLIGVSWDLMWAAIIAGVGFVVLHAVWVWWLAPSSDPDEGVSEPPPGIPERIMRHAMPERIFHWLMAVAMLVLLVTAFFPVVGIRFPWVTIHWIAGILLTLTIVYHVVHATIWQDFWAMWVDRADVQAGLSNLRGFFGGKAGEGPKAGKYPVDHKLYHHAAASAGLGAIATGLLMMLRLDTPFWAANPYMLADSTWGIVYVAHGVSGVALITLIITHIYFAIRPEKLWITRSMVYGWIGRSHYLEHHDPSRWAIAESPPQEELVPAGVGVGIGESAEADAGAGAPSEGGLSEGALPEGEQASEAGGSD